MENTAHNELANAGFTIWQAHSDWSFEDLMFNLEPQMRRATVIAALYGEVMNGGFEQWEANGFAKAEAFLLEAIEILPETTATKTVADLVKQALARFTDYKNAKWPFTQAQAEEMLSRRLDRLDQDFYEICADFKGDVEAYFAEADPSTAF